ncbi:MAG TPA: sulfotransferase domain-containing protein [Caulobacteraceae bacterium]|nr:sulfotransferase domain-containing protein [Caulobacteraceae bacterium]
MEQPEYKGPIVNNAVDTNRWDLVPPRDGDIIVAVGSKMGTTWTQMLCALLVHGPELPRPLAELSPWLDGGAWDYNEDAVEVFNAQAWRRVIKTHTPLHALKYREDAFYVTCGRDPRDAFLSGLDHNANSALPDGREPPPDRDRAFAFVLRATSQDGAPGLLDHIAGFWRHRTLPNLIFLHYADMSDDLEGEMARLAEFLGIARSPDEIRALGERARFGAMRAGADDVAPGSKVVGRWKSNADFFRKGRRGEWREVYSPETQALYVSTTRGRYDATMLDWLENGRAATGDPRDL